MDSNCNFTVSCGMPQLVTQFIFSQHPTTSFSALAPEGFHCDYMVISWKLNKMYFPIFNLAYHGYSASGDSPLNFQMLCQCQAFPLMFQISECFSCLIGMGVRESSWLNRNKLITLRTWWIYFQHCIRLWSFPALCARHSALCFAYL